MNLVLQKEILKHIFKKFGIFIRENEIQLGFIDNLLSEKFLIDKKFEFEVGEEKFSNNIWAASTTTGSLKMKILIADIREDIDEYTIIFQMDNLPAYASRLSIDETDSGSVFINAKENNWVEAPLSIQSKFLYGIEGLAGLPLQWNKLDDYKDIHKLLIQFLNFYGQ